jgi:hypothetical protein
MWKNFVVNKFFSENIAFYEIMWKNFVVKFFSENIAFYEIMWKNFVVNKFFSENIAFYEIMWKNCLQPDQVTDDSIIRRMRFA